LDDLRRELARERELSAEELRLIRHHLLKMQPMAMLRTAVSALASSDPAPDDLSPAGLRRIAARLTAKMPALVAAFHRLRSGKEPMQPQGDLSLAGNFLYMLNGSRPDPLQERAMNVSLILHADHEFNASTFAARVTASTLSDMYSAITSAVGALKGPLHGGANVQVMETLEKIGSVDRAAEYIRDQLAQKKRIAGFGHRVYRVEDPRARHLQRLARELGERKGETLWLEISEKVREVVTAEKKLNPNVDFYSASAHRALGIPADLFTPVFVISRVSGWTAHVMEQLADNRLIRPRAEYVGPRDLPYVAIDKR
jgi:citrate synthase